MQNQFQEHLKICKENIKYQRQALSEEKWKNYLKGTYPQWHEDCYGESRFPILGKFIKNSMWKVNIVFYPINLQNFENQSYKYTFRISRHTNFETILKSFHEFIKKQHTTLKLIFGRDIYEIIKNYIPNYEMNLENYFYVHKHIYEIIGGYKECTKFKRQKLPGDQKINCVRKYLDLEQNIDDLNIRLRATKLCTRSRQFQKNHDYFGGAPRITLY